MEDNKSESWDVYRRWAPRHAWFVRKWGGWRRDKRRGDSGIENALDFPIGGGDGSLLDDLAIGVVIVLVIAAFSLLAWFLILPLLLVLVDILFIAAAIVIGIATRVLLRRPWTVVAKSTDGEIREWRIVGWRRSGRACEVIASALREGADIDSAIASLR